MNKHVLIMAGGTGGHIMPALAVAKECQRRGIDVSWLGNENGLEGRLVKERHIPFYHLNISGLRGKGVQRWLKAPYRIFSSIGSSYLLMGKIKPDVVLGFGGYVGGPGGVAAYLRHIPLIIHEQNTIPGLTNRLLSRLAKIVLETFPGTFPNKKKVCQTGNPVRQEICDLASPDRRFLQRTQDPIHLVILGGSQGASVLNKAVPEALAFLKEKLSFKVTHQAGFHDLNAVKKSYQQAGVEASILSFIEDMPSLYDSADFVISRAGATTVCELACAGLGSILIPFPYAVDDHQTSNARYLEKVGAAVLMSQEQVTPKNLAAELERVCQDRELLCGMAMNARQAAFVSATQKIADICIGEINDTKRG